MQIERNRIYTEKLDWDDLPKGQTSKVYLRIAGTGMGTPIYVPVIVMRGEKDGPVVGITAAIHGNELNGIPVIHRLIRDLENISGTVIAVPVVNVPGFHLEQREFNDGIDLNRIMPGDAKGNTSQIYAHRVVERLLKKFDYLLDLHTASFGRINPMYIRADLTHDVTSWMAKVQHADILLHNTGADGTFRGTAMDLDIPCITVELGNPHTFQSEMIEEGYLSIKNVLSRLEVIPDNLVVPKQAPMICIRSNWIYTQTGGILKVFPGILQRVREGEKIAEVTNIFGEVTDEYFAPEDGVVIGKQVNPVNQTGSRIIHLGIEATRNETKTFKYRGRHENS